MAGMKKQARGLPGWRSLLEERLREASIHARAPELGGVRRHFAVMAGFDAKAGNRAGADAGEKARTRRAIVGLERRVASRKRMR